MKVAGGENQGEMAWSSLADFHCLIEARNLGGCLFQIFELLIGHYIDPNNWSFNVDNPSTILTYLLSSSDAFLVGWDKD